MIGAGAVSVCAPLLIPWLTDRPAESDCKHTEVSGSPGGRHRGGGRSGEAGWESGRTGGQEFGRAGGREGERTRGRGSERTEGQGCGRTEGRGSGRTGV